MEKRNEYREMIALRKEKEKALIETLAMEKVDLPTL
jgi:hypothetical protein